MPGESVQVCVVTSKNILSYVMEYSEFLKMNERNRWHVPNSRYFTLPFDLRLYNLTQAMDNITICQ